MPLRRESGRYIGETVEQRTCRLSPSNEVEDEKHFLLQCAMYSSFRTNIFVDILLSQDFVNLTDVCKLKHVICEFPRKCAKFIVTA
jgi:chemotaxis regulatin CheY-phosphate phosphatase CheZ